MVAVQIYWYDPEQTIIVYEFDGTWTWEDCYVVVDEKDQMLASIEHPVSVIIYARNPSLKIPERALCNLRNLVSITRPKETMFVMVGIPPMLRSLFDTLARVYRFEILKECVYTDTLEQALVVINARRVDV